GLAGTRVLARFQQPRFTTFVTSDPDGRFAFDALPDGVATIGAYDAETNGEARSSTTVARDVDDLELSIGPMDLSDDPHGTRTVVGMHLCDVDEETRKEFELPPDVHVVVV